MTDPVLQHRAAVRREVEALINAKMMNLGRTEAKLLGAALTDQYIGEHAPNLYYDGRRWSALGACKPRRRPRRLIRGYGKTIVAALDDLAHQFDRFERGDRDGEQ